MSQSQNKKTSEQVQLEEQEHMKMRELLEETSSLVERMSEIAARAVHTSDKWDSVVFHLGSTPDEDRSVSFLGRETLSYSNKNAEMLSVTPRRK